LNWRARGSEKQDECIRRPSFSAHLEFGYRHADVIERSGKVPAARRGLNTGSHHQVSDFAQVTSSPDRSRLFERDRRVMIKSSEFLTICMNFWRVRVWVFDQVIQFKWPTLKKFIWLSASILSIRNRWTQYDHQK
jgi:hypothetical protein